MISPRSAKFLLCGLFSVTSAYIVSTVPWSLPLGLLQNISSLPISQPGPTNIKSEIADPDFTGRKLGPSDWVNDLPINYTLLNQTCPYERKSALNSALLMAFVGFGTEYWYLGFYGAFQYKAGFFLFTLISTISLRFYPISGGGDSYSTLLITCFLCAMSFTCWTWQVSNFLDLYYDRATDACGRKLDPIWSFMKIYYWKDDINANALLRAPLGPDNSSNLTLPFNASNTSTS